jgi:Tol biopolymer transport system component
MARRHHQGGESVMLNSDARPVAHRLITLLLLAATVVATGCRRGGGAGQGTPAAVATSVIEHEGVTTFGARIRGATIHPDGQVVVFITAESPVVVGEEEAPPTQPWDRWLTRVDLGTNAQEVVLGPEDLSRLDSRRQALEALSGPQKEQTERDLDREYDLPHEFREVRYSPTGDRLALAVIVPGVSGQFSRLYLLPATGQPDRVEMLELSDRWEIGLNDWSWSPDGQLIAAVVADSGDVVVYDAGAVPPTATVVGSVGMEGAALARLDWSPQGDRIAIGYQDVKLTAFLDVITVATQRTTRIAQHQAYTAPEPAWSRSGKDEVYYLTTPYLTGLRAVTPQPPAAALGSPQLWLAPAGGGESQALMNFVQPVVRDDRAEVAVPANLRMSPTGDAFYVHVDILWRLTPCGTCSPRGITPSTLRVPQRTWSVSRDFSRISLVGSDEQGSHVVVAEVENGAATPAASGQVP